MPITFCLFLVSISNHCNFPYRVDSLNSSLITNKKITASRRLLGTQIHLYKGSTSVLCATVTYVHEDYFDPDKQVYSFKCSSTQLTDTVYLLDDLAQKKEKPNIAMNIAEVIVYTLPLRTGEGSHQLSSTITFICLHSPLT